MFREPALDLFPFLPIWFSLLWHNADLEFELRAVFRSRATSYFFYVHFLPNWHGPHCHTVVLATADPHCPVCSHMCPPIHSQLFSSNIAAPLGVQQQWSLTDFPPNKHCQLCSAWNSDPGLRNRTFKPCITQATALRDSPLTATQPPLCSFLMCSHCGASLALTVLLLQVRLLDMCWAHVELVGQLPGLRCGRVSCHRVS